MSIKSILRALNSRFTRFLLFLLIYQKIRKKKYTFDWSLYFNTQMHLNRFIFFVQFIFNHYYLSFPMLNIYWKIFNVKYVKRTIFYEIRFIDMKSLCFCFVLSKMHMFFFKCTILVHFRMKTCIESICNMPEMIEVYQKWVR